MLSLSKHDGGVTLAFFNGLVSAPPTKVVGLTKFLSGSQRDWEGNEGFLPKSVTLLLSQGSKQEILTGMPRFFRKN